MSRAAATIFGLFFLAVSIFLLISLASGTTSDVSRILGEVDFRLSPFELQWDNAAGLLGAYVSYALRNLFGWLSFLLPLTGLFLGTRLLTPSLANYLKIHSILLGSICLAATMIANVGSVSPGLPLVSNLAGGFVTTTLTGLLVRLLGTGGSYLALGLIIAALLVVYTSIVPFLTSWIHWPWEGMVRKLLGWLQSASGFMLKPFERVETDEEESGDFEEYLEEASSADPVNRPTLEMHSEEPKSKARRMTVKRPPEDGKSTGRKAVPVAEQIQLFDYLFPRTDLLTVVPTQDSPVTNEELQVTSKALKDTLETFHIAIEGNIERFPGPVITRYEFKPAAGVKVNQIVNLADDLALALKARQVRIIAPIPGKAAVGVEIPNRQPQMVFFREILESDEFRDPRIKLPLALGKTTAGKPFIADLTRMPHLLVAGATGAGKSVCMNVLILSLLYRFHPIQIKFVFIDPKMLELSIYDSLPHMARPVVTKPKGAEKVLSELVIEMQNRYQKMAAVSARHLDDYNKKQQSDEEKLPYIVVCIDELADLMMSSQSTRTEELITRLAQMARAAGIHLILATQRPTVDVITGLIKSNIPTRIAFQVSSRIDSRTILDTGGAEKLLGNGDMLFMNAGAAEPTRVHGAYVTSDDIEAVVNFIKEQNVVIPEAAVIPDAASDESESEGGAGDPLFKEAAEIVIRHKQGSASLLQRRLRIGYQRAARLIDYLEQAGIVSGHDGARPREVLVDKSYLDKLGKTTVLPAGKE